MVEKRKYHNYIFSVCECVFLFVSKKQKYEGTWRRCCIYDKHRKKKKQKKQKKNKKFKKIKKYRFKFDEKRVEL